MIGNTSEWTLTCGVRVTEDWALNCADIAELVEPKATTLAPTAVSVAGCGALAGGAARQITSGHPFTLSATVSAQNGSLPTGTVTFFGSEQTTANVGSAPSAIRPDLLGTANLVAASNSLAKATLTSSALPPGRCALLAMYRGDPTHLAASTVYGDPSTANGTYGDEMITRRPPRSSSATLAPPGRPARP